MTEQHSDLVYLDVNATTPLAAEVVTAISGSLVKHWGNPSSSHVYGHEAAAAVRNARQQVAGMIGASPEEIIFMSGGTEANNTVIQSCVRRMSEVTLGDARPTDSEHLPHVITTSIEHDSIALPLAHLDKQGVISVTRLPIQPTTGAVDVESVVAAVQPSTCLITIMLANNETGALQPVAAISSALKDVNQSRKAEGLPAVELHTDAAQAIGKIPVNVHDLDVDYLTIVGHKFYAPRIGALYVRTSCKAQLQPILFGGGQEGNLRPGTENTPMIVGLGQAAQLVSTHLSTYRQHMHKCRRLLIEELSASFGNDNIHINGVGSQGDVLPNTLNFSIVNQDKTGRQLLAQLPQLLFSVGAACHSDAGERPSAVLLAAGVPEDIAVKAMRWSVGRDTTEEDIMRAVTMLASVVLDQTSPPS